MAAPPLDRLLADAPQERLAALLLQLADDDPAMERKVRLALQPAGGDTRELGRAVDQALRTRRFLDYREAIAYGLDARAVVDALAKAAEGPAAREVVAIVERAVDRVVRVLLNSDDSSGVVGDVARDLLRVHARAAEAGRPDPTKLVRWLVRFTFEEQDFFNPDIRDYAAALGTPGIEAYRAEAQRRADADPAAFAPRHALQQLALLDRDAEAVVRLFGGPLDGVHRYTQVAQAFREIGDDDGALTWARRGLELPATWQSKALYDLVAEMLAAAGQLSAVLQLRTEGLESLPDATSYAALRDAATADGSWPSRRPDALAALRARSVDHLLQALLSDGDVDTAWQELQLADVSQVQESTAQRVAAARAETHPADAVPYVERALDSTLQTANRNAYRQAVRQLKELRTLHRRAGTQESFDAFLADITEANRRRPSFLDELRKAGFGRQGGTAR